MTGDPFPASTLMGTYLRDTTLVFCYKGKTFVCDTTRVVQNPGNWRQSSATQTKTDSPS
jgi:hypothetical protein